MKYNELWTSRKIITQQISYKYVTIFIEIILKYKKKLLYIEEVIYAL